MWELLGRSAFPKSVDGKFRLAFVEVNVFCKTATVCSCADTSSMVLGLLIKDRSECSDVERFYALFLDPGLKRGIHDMLLGRLGRRASGLEEGSH